MSSDRRSVVARWAAVVSLALAIAASIFVLFVPLGTTVTEQRPDGGVRHRIERRTLLDGEGATALAIAAAPISFAAAPIIVAGRRRARSVRIAAAILLLMFAGALVVSVGLFYTPAAIAMIVAAIAG